MPVYVKKEQQKRGPKKNNKTSGVKSVSPSLPNYLPRIKSLPRELLPIVGKSSLKSSIDNALFEFRNVQEILPSIKFVTDNEKEILQSPLDFFTISGEPTGFFIETNGKLRDISGVHSIPMFIKRVHLVEPIQAMEGVYSFPLDGALPQPQEFWKNTLTKIHDPYNEAYLDSLCCATVSRLVETEKSPHWCKFYGAFNGRVQKYMYNITGEISSLRHERWFNKHQKSGMFKIRVVGDDPECKPPVQIFEDGGAIECTDLENLIVSSKVEDDASIVTDDSNAEDINTDDIKTDDIKTDDIKTDDIKTDDNEELEEEEDEEEDNSTEESECLSQSPSTDEDSAVEILEDRPVRIIKLDDDDSKSSSDKTSSEEESQQTDYSEDYNFNTRNECEYFAEFTDFPVQVTLMERCTGGTMDALLDIEEDSVDPEFSKTKDIRWSAWVFQVIAALSVAQYYYGFVHNDLHTNNVMWSPTSDAYIYYRLTGLNTGEKFYRVPTFGKLMKVIDFGRASFWLKDRKSLIITDSYAEGNDASGQYNCPPYYDPSEPTVNPNPSFDLCRLAVSMFDALYPEQPQMEEPPIKMSEEDGRITFETESPLYNLLWRWLTDCDGKNILRNPNDSERFPDFDLYKHIARCANKSIPSEEAQKVYFESIYSIQKQSIPSDAKVWDLPLN
jgi:hypothetical protein